jgi:UDP-MurNAc hydroxylase
MSDTSAMGLSFQFVGNACGIFQGGEGTRLLCDPWIENGVFEGSWCHFPPLRTTVADLQSVDAIYVSHIHPDHFDERNFDFPRSLPIFILERANNFLAKKLTSLGYTKVHLLSDDETVQFRELELTMYEPFTTHNFHEAKIGNVIDSALVVRCGDSTAFDANDNTPTPDACRKLRDRWGHFDLAMLNYNAAGPYPSCFNNLSKEQKKAEHRRILERNMAYMSELVAVLEPRACLPFAGAYVIGGSQHSKNEVLGTTTWDACAEYLRARLHSCKVITLRESDVLNLETLTSDREYVPLDPQEQERYIRDELADLRYPYQDDDIPNGHQLLADLEVAARLMAERSARFGFESTFCVTISVGDFWAQVLPEFKILPDDFPRVLRCSLDPRLLRRILDRKSQWNSAEIGCHIDFVRQPNEYEPDLHMMLQFLHL